MLWSHYIKLDIGYHKGHNLLQILNLQILLAYVLSLILYITILRLNSLVVIVKSLMTRSTSSGTPTLGWPGGNRSVEEELPRPPLEVAFNLHPTPLLCPHLRPKTSSTIWFSSIWISLDNELDSASKNPLLLWSESQSFCSLRKKKLLMTSYINHVLIQVKLKIIVLIQVKLKIITYIKSLNLWVAPPSTLNPMTLSKILSNRL